MFAVKDFVHVELIDGTIICQLNVGKSLSEALCWS